MVVVVVVVLLVIVADGGAGGDAAGGDATDAFFLKPSSLSRTRVQGGTSPSRWLSRVVFSVASTHPTPGGNANNSLSSIASKKI